MDIQLLLVPYDTARRGWRSGAGPKHLVQSGLPAHLEARGHRVADVQVIEDDPAESPAEVRTAFELMRRVATAVHAARAGGRFPVVLSGNCNVAVGALSGLTPAARSIFWFDAHGESNTPDTTASGFLDGMGLSTALGWCWRAVAASVPGFQPVAPEATFLLGARDLDPPEAALLSQSRVTVVPVSEVSHRFPDRLAAAPLPEGLGYLHLDPDVLDPDSVGRANSHPVPNGLSVAQVTAAISAIRARTPLGAATIASYAPEYDRDGAICRAAFAALDAILTPLDARARPPAGTYGGTNALPQS
jgi:arginase